jgi:hypothetical protein
VERRIDFDKVGTFDGITEVSAGAIVLHVAIDEGNAMDEDGFGVNERQASLRLAVYNSQPRTDES